jgi:hypothetical protein
MDDIYSEDVVIDENLRVGPYVIPEREMLEATVAWDQLPILSHLDTLLMRLRPPAFEFTAARGLSPSQNACSLP